MNESVSFSLFLKDLVSAPLARLGQVGRAALGSLDRMAEEVNKELEETDKKAKKASNSLGGLGGELKQLAGAYLGWEGLQKAFDISARMEDNKLAFEVLFKDAQLADAYLTELANRKSPMKAMQLADISKQLRGFGFDIKDLLPTLDMFGDFAAVVGAEKIPQLTLALGQVRNAGVLQGDELRQFSESAIPVLEALSKTLGKSTAEIKSMASEGEISFQQLYDALQSLRQEGGLFYGASEKMANGLTYKLNFALGRLTLQVNRLMENFKPLLKGLLDGLALFLQNDAAVNTLATSLVVGGSALLAYKMGLTLSTAATWAKIRAFNFASLSAMGFSFSLRAIGKAIFSIPIVGWIALAVEGFILLWQHSEKFRGGILGIWEVVKAFYNGMKPLIEAMWHLMTFDPQAAWNSAKKFVANRGTVDFRAAFDKGMKAGKSNDDKPPTFEELLKKNPNAGGGGVPIPSGSDEGKGVSVGRGRGRSVIVHINNVIGSMSVQASNMREGALEVREIVAREVTNAIRDIELSYE